MRKLDFLPKVLKPEGAREIRGRGKKASRIQTGVTKLLRQYLSRTFLFGFPDLPKSSNESHFGAILVC